MHRHNDNFQIQNALVPLMPGSLQCSSESFRTMRTKLYAWHASSHIRWFWIRIYSIRCIAFRSKIFAIWPSNERESILPLNRQFTAFCLIEPRIDSSTIPLSKRKRFCGNYGQPKDTVVQQKMNTVRANRPADRCGNTELAEKKNF